MIKILAIGNSFSEDATRYLHQIAKVDKTAMKVVNLYIGGCALALHYKNINNDYKAYDFQFNGVSTGLPVSIKDALESDCWDYVTLQQQSGQSLNYDTYQPFLNILAEYVHKYAPKAKILIHQTWGYKPESETLERFGYDSHSAMFQDVKEAYNIASKELGVDRIPSGQVMEQLVINNMDIYRDDIHASLGVGRFALALTWYKKLTGNSIDNIVLKEDELDEPISKAEYELIRKAVNSQL